MIGQITPSYDIHLLSGDNDSELPALIPIFTEKNRLHFRQSPSDKLDYVRSLRNQGRTVLMVGDGLNDAGALKESDVGISVADNVYHFSPACDAILESGKFHRLGDFLKFTKTSMKIIRLSFVLSFMYNTLGITLAAMGYFTPVISAILMPVSSVTVVLFVTGATTFMAKKAKITDGNQ
jgi:Cu+-exporting ATPase